MNRALSRAARLRHIENLLFRNPHGLRVAEMAAACNVNRRTIYRDISLLSDSGVPLWQDQNRYGIIREQYLATVRLKFHEAVALYIASRLLSRHADEHNPHIISALNKLVATFPDPLATHTSKTAESIQNRPINHTYVKILETIAMGWAENRKIKLWYRSPRSGQVRERTLSPYLLEPSPAGGLYVIGYDDWAKELRTFKLERLEDAQLLQDGYEIPISFDPAEHLANSWGIMT
nr:WYL domain-containing protein [Anaerolineae bacterium]